MATRSARHRGAKPDPALAVSPAGAGMALLLVDVINTLDFPGAGELVRQSVPTAKRIARLSRRARAARVPVVYVNDNFGRWRSDWRQVIDVCLAESSPGREMVSLLQPQPEDYFVLKPKHSGFYSTTLDLLLRALRVETVVLAGFATDICILFTANDAYMRGYHVVVPRDCVAANTRALSARALEQIRTLLKAATPPSSRLAFRRQRGASRSRPQGSRSEGEAS